MSFNNVYLEPDGSGKTVLEVENMEGEIKTDVEVVFAEPLSDRSPTPTPTPTFPPISIKATVATSIQKAFRDRLRIFSDLGSDLCTVAASSGESRTASGRVLS